MQEEAHALKHSINWNQQFASNEFLQRDTTANLENDISIILIP